MAIPSAASAAPERVVEQVAPPDAGGYPIYMDTVGAAIAPTLTNVSSDGDHVMWFTPGDIDLAIPDGGTALYGVDAFVSSRADDTWRTRWMSAYPSIGEHHSPGVTPIAMAEDGSRILYATPDDVVPGAPAGLKFVLETAEGSRTVLGTTGWSGPSTRLGIDATDDLFTVVFESSDRLLDEDTDPQSDVYLWREGQPLTLVSRRGGPAGVPVGLHGRISPGTIGVSTPEAQNAMSPDGRTIYFSMNEDPAIPEGMTNRSFVWHEGEVESVGVGPARFLAASEDGRYAYFTDHASSPLTLFSDVQRFDRETGGRAPVATAPIPGIPAVQLVGVSGDGNVAVVQSGLPLVPADDADSGPSLYRWTAVGGLEYMAPVTAMDFLPVFLSWLPIRVSYDGSVIAFASTFQGLDDTTADVSDVFVYSERTLRRVTAAGDESLPAFVGTSQIYVTGRGMTRDGSTVFITTRRRLLPADTNEALDVYELDVASDALALVSPGNAEEDAVYVDNSTDGETVVFTSAQQLYDDRGGRPFLYAARVGGRAPTPPRGDVGCAGDGCQGPVPPRPGTQQERTSGHEGPGDALDPAPPAARWLLARLTRGDALRLLRTGRLRLAVQVDRPGRVYVEGTVRVRGRARRLVPGSRTWTRPGAASIAVGLSRRARRALGATGRVRVAVVARFTESDGTRRSAARAVARASTGKRG